VYIILTLHIPLI